MIEIVVALSVGMALGAMLYRYSQKKPYQSPLPQMSAEHLVTERQKIDVHAEMLQNVAHHWRQPLNALSLTIQDLQDAYAYNEVDEVYLDKMVGESLSLIQEMSVVIDQFKNFYKEGSEKAIILLEPLLEEITHLFGKSIKDANIDFVTNIPTTFDTKTPISIIGYPNEFRQVIIGLIRNAKEAILSTNNNADIKGVITLNLKEDKRYIYLEIEDNGSGIHPNIQEKIFHPYFSTKAINEASGLGLFMIKLMIEQNMQGNISYKSQNNQTIFQIKLPAQEPNHD